MWLKCNSQQEIADSVGLSRQEINDRIADFITSTQMRDSDIFGNFDDSDRKK